MHLCMLPVESTLGDSGWLLLGLKPPLHTTAGSGLQALRAQLSLLRIDSGGRPVSVGDLRAEVEPEPGAVRLSLSPRCLGF